MRDDPLKNHPQADYIRHHLEEIVRLHGRWQNAKLALEAYIGEHGWPSLPPAASPGQAVSMRHLDPELDRLMGEVKEAELDYLLVVQSLGTLRPPVGIALPCDGYSITLRHKACGVLYAWEAAIGRSADA